MLKLKDAQRLRKIFHMSPEEILVYMSSEAADGDKKAFKETYNFTLKQAEDSLYELKRIINQ